MGWRWSSCRFLTIWRTLKVLNSFMIVTKEVKVSFLANFHHQEKCLSRRFFMSEEKKMFKTLLPTMNLSFHGTLEFVLLETVSWNEKKRKSIAAHCYANQFVVSCLCVWIVAAISVTRTILLAHWISADILQHSRSPWR